MFGDFQQVWAQRCPGSALPSAWEEDIRANLEKHKQKVKNLQEELVKEETYVEYLERLLSDIEKRKEPENLTDQNVDTPISLISETISKEAPKTEPSAPPSESPQDQETSVDKCISELSATLKSKKGDELIEDLQDPSSFVTVIEINGQKNNLSASPPSPATKQQPPIPPAKPKVKPALMKEDSTSIGGGSVDSMLSSNENLNAIDEPYYDIVAPETEGSILKSGSSSTENVFSNSSTLPLHAKNSILSAEIEPQSPEPQGNYVNIEYFILKNGGHASEDEDEAFTDGAPMRQGNDSGSYASSSSLESSTPATRRKFSQVSQTDSERGETERSQMYKSLVMNIIDSETNYVEWLYVLIVYMKAIEGSLKSSQPVMSSTEYDTIFYKIPEIHQVHTAFLDALKKHSNNWHTRVGDAFKLMAANLELYGAFLSNYGRAVDTAKKCSETNLRFAEISKNITCKQVSKQQSVSLEELLHKPVARMQKNTLVLYDLVKLTPTTSPDYTVFMEVLYEAQKFLDQFNMIQTKSMFPANDRAQRRLVKNSFIVENVDGGRKLRHLFLFNDVIACAKYKSTGRSEKYTFELKWFIPVEDIVILEEVTANPHEVPASELVSLKSQASNARDQIRQEDKNAEDKKGRVSRGGEKVRKRLLDLESQLVLKFPNLMFRIKQKQSPKIYTFFQSSEFERTQWIETINTLQKTSRPPTPNSNFTMLELQTWITACRAYLKTNMGSYLLRSGHDESLLVGDLHITVHDLKGLQFAADVFICIEVDFYGHFCRKAKTKMICNTSTPSWDETFVIDLEGCENLRILIYRENEPNVTLIGKFTQQLSRFWLKETLVERKINVSGIILRYAVKFMPFEVTLRRVPGKGGPLFGEKIQQVCKRQKRDIPFIVTACVREVERRGMSEVGIYRVSGSASDLAKLKKSFESNSYEAEQFLKEVDIHSVTGILRSYLRELPEALFTDSLYPVLLDTFNKSNENLTKRTELLRENFKKLPKENQATIEYILDHLIKIFKHENENKMSLHNLATVFGPTLLRPGGKLDKQKSQLASETIDVMAQAGILYCFLQDRRTDC